MKGNPEGRHGQVLVGPACHSNGVTQVDRVLEKSTTMRVWVGVTFIVDSNESGLGLDKLGACWDYDLGAGTISSDRGNTHNKIGFPAKSGDHV